VRERTTKMEEVNKIVGEVMQLAFDNGRKFERENTLHLLEHHKQDTKCDCPGCESWTNAFEFLIREIKGEIND
jgi:hypothetical protein